MAKIIEISIGFLAEENTLKNALLHYKAERENYFREQKTSHDNKYVPNQHIIIADINNCKSLLKKLNSK
jgi:hypothetical protein